VARKRKAHRQAARSAQAAPSHARTDAFVNWTTGAGTPLDKIAQARVVPTRDHWRDPFVLETLYYESDLAARIVDAVVEAAMRQGYEPVLRPSLDGSREDDEAEVKVRAEAIKRRLRELKADELITTRAKNGRLQGGAALFLGAEDGNDPSLPLVLDKVRTLRFLAEFERIELLPDVYYRDPLDAKFGRVKTWRCNPGGLAVDPEALDQARVIHESRLLTFGGIEVSKRERQKQQGWDLSVLIRVIDVLRLFDANWAAISAILQQAHQAVWKLKGLVDIISGGHAQKLQERMAQVELVRGISRAVVIDADTESFEYHSASMAGLDTLIDRLNARLAAAAGMPVTILFGVSPAGMNATGESDTRHWYDTVQSYRDNVLGPQIEKLVRVVAQEQGDPLAGEWTITWPSLWQMSPRESAEQRKLIADTDVLYINAGVVTPQEVAVSRFGGGAFSDEAVHIDLELRELAEQAPDPEATEAAYPALSPDNDTTVETAEPEQHAVDPELAKNPSAALNGAQVASLQEIVQSVARRDLPRDSGLAMMLAAFPIDEQQAEAIMGDVGRTFFSASVPEPGEPGA
jgi:uncharacterized protein